MRNNILEEEERSARQVTDQSQGEGVSLCPRQVPSAHWGQWCVCVCVCAGAGHGHELEGTSGQGGAVLSWFGRGMIHGRWAT